MGWIYASNIVLMVFVNVIGMGIIKGKEGMLSIKKF